MTNDDEDEIWLREVDKPQFSVAVNHWVQAINIPSVAPNKSMYGIVVNVDDTKKLLQVYFDDLGGEKMIPFHTSKLRWYEAMSSQRAEGILRMLNSSTESSLKSPPKYKKKSPRSPRPFDFLSPVERPEIDNATNGYYVRIIGNCDGDVVEGKIVGVNGDHAKKTMRIQSIVDGKLIDEFHDNVPYSYRDPNRIKWYQQ